jgi:ssDNA-binding Zn-finger/Zn-ribbon topoisomerase 1
MNPMRTALLESRWFKPAVLTVIVLGLAGTVLAFREWFVGPNPAPDTPGSETCWYCPNCRSGFTLTARQYEKLLRFTVDDANTQGSGAAPLRSRTEVACPTCRSAAVAAVRCPKDGAIFDPRPRDGTAGRCPECDTPARAP